MNLQKPKRERDEKYLAWIRTQDCVLLEPSDEFWILDSPRVVHIRGHQLGNCEANHIRKVGHGGLGTKPSDLRVLPFCAELHREYHAIGHEPFERKYHVDLESEILRLNREYQALNVKPSRTRKQGVRLKNFNVLCDCWRKQHTIPKSKGLITGRCLVFTCPTTSKRKEVQI